MISQYAPAQRSGQREVQEQIKLVANHYSLIKPLYDAVSEIVLVVNQNRQIVFFNNIFPSYWGSKSLTGFMACAPVKPWAAYIHAKVLVDVEQPSFALNAALSMRFWLH